MQGSEISLASLGIVATVISVLVWLIKSQQTQSNTVIYELSKSQVKVAEAIERQTKLMENQEEITEKWQKFVTARFNELKKTTDETLVLVKNNKEGI